MKQRSETKPNAARALEALRPGPKATENLAAMLGGFDGVFAALADIVAAKILETLSMRAEADEQARLLDRRKLAQALDCSTDLVDKLRREGLPTVWLGDTPKFELDAVLAWLRERPAPGHVEPANDTTPKKKRAAQGTR